ncbi:cation/H(+) antiporter 20-like [Malania oleifera]|uniref:cation/H(+) antiporter 20-like n=1 Tax=Malania oleifera TaxID=397392 RepID=UPI0025AE1E79|nr:cation/H(+) antiporter 20-like [Malania oleifera]
MAIFNSTTSLMKASSDGAWAGDNPLTHAFPLLLLQTTLVLSFTRLLTFLLKPLRQPKVIAEILGGILLGPSALGRNKDFLHLVFPSWSTPILESIANVGLLFFLFLVGLELDLSSVRRSGRRAFYIALAGISVPFILAIGITFILRKSVPGADNVPFTHSLMFMGVSLSITAFPVLARILAELKLLTTQVGETAMAAAAFNDFAAWILLALAVALAGNGESPLTSIWVLISGVAFVAFMLVLIRPAMNWVSRQCPPDQDFVDEAYIFLTLAGVMLSGFTTDLIGIHAIFGAFVFGLTIPKGGEFAGRVIRRIEDFVSGLLLPLYFAASGLKTDLWKISGVEAWGLLALVITTACAGKIFGTFVAAALCMVPARESLALGVLMNTKGLVELIVLNIGKEKKVLNDEMYAILVLMALFTTFITTPTVMAIYKPSGSRTSHHRPHHKLRVLACVHGPGNFSSLINLLELTKHRSPLRLYLMHLVELTARPSSISMAQRSRKNGFPFTGCFRRGEPLDHVAAAYGKHSRVTVKPTTAVSVLSRMHEDICHVAEEKGAAMIVLPFHKQWRWGEEGLVETSVGHGWKGVNERVLEITPCTVVVLVDRGFGRGGRCGGTQRVCVVFVGGVDDRKALELGERMAENPSVEVTIVRFVLANMSSERISEVDEAVVAKIHAGTMKYIEKEVKNIVEEVVAIGQRGEYELVVVGKSSGGRLASTAIQGVEHENIEDGKLGVIGGVLASSEKGIVSSVLVIQQCVVASTDEELEPEVIHKANKVDDEDEVAITTMESTV